MIPANDEARMLLQLAERDYKAYRLLENSPEIHIASALFHAQQCVEKLMKAVLVSREIIFRKTHNLVELSDLLVGDGVQSPMEPSTLDKLNPYAVGLRYGETETEISKKEAEMIVETVRRWVGKVISGTNL